MRGAVRTIAGFVLAVGGLTALVVFDSLIAPWLPPGPDGSIHSYTLLQVRIILIALLVPGLALLASPAIDYWRRRTQRVVMRQPVGRFFLRWLLVALVIRVAYLLVVDIPIASDAAEYDRLARTLNQTGCYCVGTIPTAYRPIGYPAFLAALYGIFGPSPIVGAVANLLLSLVTCVLGYRLAEGLISVKAARLTMILLALLPSQWLWTNMLMSEVLYTLLLLAALVFATRRSCAAMAAAGVLLGLAALTRPITLLVPVAMVGYWWATHRRAMPTAARLIIAVLVMVATTTPWMIRNARQVGSPTIATSGGVNFYIGNHEDASFGYQAPDPSLFPLDDPAREAELDRLGYRLGVRNVLDDPGAFVVRGILKVVWLFAFDPEPLQYELLSASRDRRDIALAGAVTAQGLYMLLLAAAARGMWLSIRRRDYRLLASIGSVVVYWAAVHFVFFGGGRFHAPIIPLLVIMAASWITHDWYRDTPRRIRSTS